MAPKIEDYALIGDMEAAALVDRNGSIDWLCWPDFSSEACFASLLGTPENGYWKIAPLEGEFRSTRRYRDHTLILETTYEHLGGAVRLIDFMPPRGRHSDVVRIVEGVRGSVPMRMQLALRFEYGHVIPWVTGISDGIRAVAGPNLAVLHASVPVRGEDMTSVADFTVHRGDRVWFTLTYGDSWEPDPPQINWERALHDTLRIWRTWNKHLKYQGKYRETIELSLMVLKAMTFRPTGGIVAAVTTSLPERIGGVRNWDYRYCWMRDSTFTLLALMNGGHFDEAEAWQDWLLRALGGSPDQVQIMYGLRGEQWLKEGEIGWLTGYEDSRPVRVGNAAALQVQLDIYGEMMDSFYHVLHGLKRHTEDDFRVLCTLMKHLVQVWQQPDEGIWETRGGRQQFTYSKMMAWVAFDRAVMLSEQYGFKGPVDTWKTIRDAIHAEICDRAFSREKKSFTGAYGSEQLDAAMLLMPAVGFLPGSDARVKGTVEAIERELMPQGFVQRYNSAKFADGLPQGEGAFLACSFWMVSALKAIGRKRDAVALFEKLLAVRNDLGLLSEEYDPRRKRLVGNYPQAFSHIALVNAAFDLQADGAKVRERSHRHVGRKPTKNSKSRAAR
jgi:GH15 family glucan-1,4-alpha-glucosidase